MKDNLAGNIINFSQWLCDQLPLDFGNGIL